MDIKTSLLTTTIVAVTLSLLLCLIKVPSSPYTRKLSYTKTAIAICFAIAGIIFGWTIYRIDFEWSDTFPAMMTFIVTGISSTILSSSLMHLLDISSTSNDRNLLNVIVDIIFAFALVFYYDNPLKWVRITVFAVSIALFIAQCIAHIIAFNKAYMNALHNLEIYYDEDEEHKLKWIRFCYILMMLTQMFVLVYLLLPSSLMKVYVLFYALFMLYFSANFISFLGSHKILLDAFAYKALSGEGRQRKTRKVESRPRKKDDARKSTDELIYTDKDLKKLDHAISVWVEAGKYKEYDKTREEIAEELRTSKELLQIYFADKGMDFRTWRTRLRIEDAKKELLSNKNLSVNIIAERCGFSDRSNFHRQFQKIVGCSPKIWRETDGNPAAEGAGKSEQELL